MPTPIEIMRDEITARIARLNYAASTTPSAIRRSERRVYVKNALTDSAKIFIIHGDRAHRDWKFLASIWKEAGFLTNWPISIDQLSTLGGAKAVYSRIMEGGLGIDDRLGIWTGGFFRGLKMSGALRPYGERQWSIWESRHRVLIMDMEGMTAFNRLESRSGRNGVRRLRRCPASYLPAEPEDGAAVVAGLLAGSNIREVNHENWIEVAGTDEIIKLLNGWGIMWQPGFMFRGRQSILVPPFYAPLFSNFLPLHSMERLSAIKKPALCPILPAIYWDLVMREKNLPVIPFKGALPFSCSMRTFRRRGWKRRELHLMAVRMGINVVEPRMQLLMRSWYESKVRLRGEGGSKNLEAASPVIAAPGNDLEQPHVGIGTDNIGAVRSS